MLSLLLTLCAVASGAAAMQPVPTRAHTLDRAPQQFAPSPAPSPSPPPSPSFAPSFAPAPKTPPMGVVLREIAAALEEVPSAECRRQATIVLEGLQNYTVWALRMADATAKPPSELLRGNLRVLGDLDGCVGVVSPGAAVRGQYCLANVEVDTDDDVWSHLLDIATSNRRGGCEVTRDRMQLGQAIYPTTARMEWGVCAPSACAAVDVEAALNAAARRLLRGTRLRLNFAVPDGACQKQLGSARPLGPADYAFLTVVVVTLLLIIVGTTYDGFCKEDFKDDTNAWSAAVRAFSLRANWERLASGRPSGDVGCVDGVRALSTVWVVLTHKVLQLAQEPWINKYRLFEAVEDLAKMPMVNSMLNVDTFFMMSGMLRSYNVVGALSEGRFSYTSSLLQRYLRLSPVYFIVVWFYATLFEYVGSGPAWQDYIGSNVQMCRENWYFNILYINNYVDLKRLCMLQSWYLSADMQLFALAPLALIPLFRWRNAGRALMAALLAFAVAVPAVIVAIWRLPGVYQLSNSDQQIHEYMQYVYSPTHTRMSSYLVGLALGYILNRLRNQKFTMSRIWVALGWTACACLLVGDVYGPYHMMQMGHEYDLTENVVYGALHRVVWALAVAWLVFACHTGYGGLVNRLLNCYVLRGLSRLSYCVYLSHYIVLLLNTTRIRTAIWMDEFLLLHSYIGDLAISVVLSIILFLAFESPVFFLLRKFFPRGSTKATKVVSNAKTTAHIAASGEHQK